MNLVAATPGNQTMSSLALRELVNEEREAAGQPRVRNDQFIARIEDELAGELGVCKTIAHPQSGALMHAYELTHDQCMLVAIRESKAVRRRVVEKLKQVAIPQTRAQALRLAADLEEQNAVLALENQQLAQRNEHLESLFTPGMTPVDFCKKLNGVNTSQVNAFLERRGWLYNESEADRRPRWRVKSYARDRYLTEKIGQEIRTSTHSFIPHTAQLLQAGAVRLYELYRHQELPMKAAWNGEFTHAKSTGDTRR